MSVNVNDTEIIDNDGKVDWNKIKNANVITGVAATRTTTSGGGNITGAPQYSIEQTGTQVRFRKNTPYSNCNCNCNCQCRC